MIDFIFYSFWIILYLYYTYQNGEFEKGRGKSVVLLMISLISQLIFTILNIPMVGFLISIGVFLLFDLFYDNLPFKNQWLSITLYGVAIIVLMVMSRVTPYVDTPVITTLICLLLILVLSIKRKNLKFLGASVIIISYLLLIVIEMMCIHTIWTGSLSIFAKTSVAFYVEYGITIFSVIIFLVLEVVLLEYKKDYEISTKDFQQNVLIHQYEEIKNIYLNMRGWRHDYHNHLQVMKAQMELGRFDEVRDYLGQLEQDLDGVDTYVKSGNLMLDAILNSKLSLAQDKKIVMHCKASVPEVLTVTDVDLCVILGNLLDNAIEACEQIEEDARFLRIYITVNGAQLYLSIQNSAKEILNFNERNYISSKRGNHGLGMKRVKVLVDKYGGFLNLQNEPGIFAVEVLLPLIKNIS